MVGRGEVAQCVPQSQLEGTGTCLQTGRITFSGWLNADGKAFNNWRRPSLWVAPRPARINVLKMTQREWRSQSELESQLLTHAVLVNCSLTVQSHHPSTVLVTSLSCICRTFYTFFHHHWVETTDCIYAMSSQTDVLTRPNVLENNWMKMLGKLSVNYFTVCVHLSSYTTLNSSPAPPPRWDWGSGWEHAAGWGLCPDWEAGGPEAVRCICPLEKTSCTVLPVTRLMSRGPGDTRVTERQRDTVHQSLRF